MRFIKFYRGFSKVLMIVLTLCFTALIAYGTKFISGSALDDAEFAMLCVSLILSLIIAGVWVILEDTYQQEIERLMRKRNKTRKGGNA